MVGRIGRLAREIVPVCAGPLSPGRHTLLRQRSCLLLPIRSVRRIRGRAASRFFSTSSAFFNALLLLASSSRFIDLREFIIRNEGEGYST